MSVQRSQRMRSQSEFLLEEAQDVEGWLTVSRATSVFTLQDSTFAAVSGDIDSRVTGTSIGADSGTQSEFIDIYFPSNSELLAEPSPAFAESPPLFSSGGPGMSLLGLLQHVQQQDPPRRSLMSLLQQEDAENMLLWCARRLSLGGNANTNHSEFSEEVGVEPDPKMGDTEVDSICCICMVGTKGAAFIPCGHTFCRGCTRKLYIERGLCPLCNQEIQDVLNIY
ncbi:hypothetical protein R1flu_015487 [Riccia fluitans]|uniref:RING-type domain-containing protein n=1 Tax=Riccia fluitans TaxID=41844 RepID=A0ABD1YJK3_9MARC